MYTISGQKGFPFRHNTISNLAIHSAWYVLQYALANADTSNGASHDTYRQWRMTDANGISAYIRQTRVYPCAADDPHEFAQMQRAPADYPTLASYRDAQYHSGFDMINPSCHLSCEQAT